jgi:FtsZ-binding cell division protein ZapB
MDSQLKEVLAAMQNEIAEMRGKNEMILKENGSMHGVIERISKENERILKENERIFNQNERTSKENERILQENESMHDEIEKIRNENERIDKDLASVRKDLEAARVQHTSDVDALREVTALLVPLHLRVLLDLARKKVLEHLGYETWEGLRASRSVLQLADTIFNDLKQKGVSYPPSFQSVFFLCSYNNIRRAGNTAAHSAKEDDIRHAVLTQALDSQDRKCLESLFTYAYNGEQV